MPASLSDKWGDESIWLRTLFVKSNLIWIFRNEFPSLLVNELTWLDAILKDAYLVASVEARHFDSNEAAFERSIEIVKNNIEQRISTLGSDAELERLKSLMDGAVICDHLQEIFRHLATRTRAAYGIAYARKAALEPKWMNDHPLKSSHGGDYPDPYHVTAKTAVDGNRATIRLQVHLDGFEVMSLLAIPALLTHELVCHAHAKESDYDSRSIWAEGVMDWTAMFFFEQWSWHLDLPYGNIDEHGKLLWARRANRSRLTGRYAASDLAKWLANEPSVRGINVARRVTAKLALDVNSWEAPLTEKDTLATRLAKIRHDKALQQAIRAWRSGSGPVSDLLG